MSYRKSGKLLGLALGMLLSALLVLALLGGSSVARARAASEYDMKAAYLFNFAKFINWPEGSFAEEDQPIQICVLGRDDFGDALGRVSRGRTVQGRTIQIKKLTGGGASDSEARSCNILFVSRSESGREVDLLSVVGDRPVVTVGEVEGFTEIGGVFNYVAEGSRVRFELNRKSAAAKGLSVSSRLVRLADVTD